MTKKHWMFLAVLLAAGFAAPLFAADPPVIPADPPTTKKTAPKKAASKTDAAKSSPGVVVLPAPETAVVSANVKPPVNVRGQASYTSEIVARLNKGDKVTVLEEITTKKKKDEPDRWYKISVPQGAGVWVHSSFLDADRKVKPNRLNLRSGGGENYSVIGRIEKGTQVNVVETKGDWSKIDPPAEAYAFVAAHLLTREPAAAPPIAVVPPPPPPPPVTVVDAAPPVVPAQPPPAVVQPPPTENPPILTPVIRPIPPEEPLPKRVVTREGIVKGSVSVQAPTHFALRGLDNHRTVNYLYSPSTNIVIKNFKNQRVVVTGEESLDERWPNTPVIEVETIQPVQ